MGSDDILTSEETEALLDGVKDGAVSTGDGSNTGQNGIIDIDVTEWDRITRGRVPALESINERFAGLARIALFQLFRKTVEISMDQVHMQKWGEYVDELPAPASLNLVSSGNVEDAFLVAVDAALVFELVDSFFGGRGGSGRKPDAGDFTPTEIRQTRNVVSRLLESFQEAWSTFLDRSFEYVRHESNPQFAVIAAAADQVYVTRLHIEIDGHGGELHMVLPTAMVDPIRHYANVGSHTKMDDNKDHWKTALQEDVRDASVTLRTVLTEMQINLRDLVNMKAGDVIPVELPGIVTVYAGDSTVIEGSFGVSRGRNAVKVIRAASTAATEGRDNNERDRHKA